ncbi:MAG: hypothetical protein COT71_01855 [Candidatus Andersenbacteria bacterium CG10_big_fil_rev_8_21_14_0_10_54_11]|uniref:DUF456 domain-containing protein n=1 Tax=Candidatus Andersenbacteria bacterium CG10_big_fil_rev_8_21_14_0_10_54_11 TaxID=1974485 RepID=A0A2M6WZP3_9BACT|nr:MAG: hypothetical protein COT71_01855 [Candidatus Andersenbacteria bacterium CG10_big_fil_rev_8_21_14_0_10_54_11]
MSLFIIWFIVSLLFLAGLAGIFIPAVPGIALVFAGILVYAAVTGFAVISVPMVIVLSLIALLAWLADWFGPAAGARLGGGGKATILGSVIGLLLGLMMGSPLGIAPGAFLGALAGALYEGKSGSAASRAAVFSVLGLLGAAVVQFILALGMIAAFFVAVYW